MATPPLGVGELTASSRKTHGAVMGTGGCTEGRVRGIDGCMGGGYGSSTGTRRIGSGLGRWLSGPLSLLILVCKDFKKP